MDFQADLTIPDYTESGIPNVDHRAYLFRPAGPGPYPLLVNFPEVGVKVTSTLTEADGLPYYARAEGLAVLNVGYTQPQRGVFTGADDHDHPARDARWVVQRARMDAAAWRIDSSRIVLRGVGLGARAVADPALAADYADPLGGAQAQQSSRVLGAILERGVALWSAQKQASTSAYPDFSAAGTDKLDAIAGGVQDAASPLLYGDDARNAEVRVLSIHPELAESTDYTAPYPADQLVKLGNAWHGEAIRARLNLLGSSAPYWNRAYSTAIPGQGADLVTLEALGWLLWVVGRLPVEELVIRAIEERLRQVTHANGYGIDVQRVERHETISAFRVYPSIVVTALGSSYDDALFSTKSHNKTRIGLSLINAGVQRWTERASIFLAAVRRALDHSQVLESRPRGTGSPLVVHIIDARRFVDELGGLSRSGVVCELEITWRDELGDPHTELG